MKSARLQAFEVLDGVLRRSAYSNLSLEAVLAETDSGDKAFLTSLVYGVIERKITLEYLLQQHLKGRTKPKVKTLLMLGAYQLYFMEKVPDSAAVNETVKLADAVGCTYYKPLINAVLRKLAAQRVDIENTEDLSVRYSCPQPLIHMWQKQYGEDAAMQILQSLNGRPPVFAVVNTKFADADELIYELACDGIEAARVDGCDRVVQILSSFQLADCRAFRNGLFHIEDLSAFRCAQALGAVAGDTVIDFCAAPGGKSFSVAELMQDSGTVYALDVHAHRVALIQQGASRLELTCVKAQQNDATVFNAALPKADCVLCDVPCSGFGIIRRKPEIRYKTLDSVKELPALQYSILSTAVQYLKEGGTAVYATCTLNQKENERVVERFLNEHHAFTVTEMKTILPSQHGGDGFFYAVLKKQ